MSKIQGKNSIQSANRIKIKDKGKGNKSKSETISASCEKLGIYLAVLLKREAAAIAAPAIKG